MIVSIVRFPDFSVNLVRDTRTAEFYKMTLNYALLAHKLVPTGIIYASTTTETDLTSLTKTTKTTNIVPMATSVVITKLTSETVIARRVINNFCSPF